MTKISIIGLGLSYKDLTEQHLSVIHEADVLAGGKRHLGYFPDFSGETLEITKNLKGLAGELEQLQAAGRKVVVLASGDPLFYGIGSYLSKHLGKDKVTVYPNISSVSAAFSRINTSWQDAAVISFHGRKIDTARFAAFSRYDKLAIMTDKDNTPEMIDYWLKIMDITGFRICVLEHLGEDTERIQWFGPGRPVIGSFRDPNIMIFIRAEGNEANIPVKCYPGMPSHEFRHENGMITKSEIRVVSLSKLRLEEDSILWDLGAGSGSVAIEASFFIRTGRIFAVEKNASRYRDILENQERFQVSNLMVCCGRLPIAMVPLPDPDRVFIGGGGRDLAEIIVQAADRLRPGGIMVINTVLLKNMARSLEILEQLGFETNVTQIQVSSDHKMPWDRMLKSRNPVWIIQGIKKNEKE